MQTLSKTKNFLLPFLLLATGSAWAGWELIYTTDEATFYADLANLRKDGNLRKVWELTNLNQPAKDGAMSYRMRFEYDCQKERHKVLALTSHPQPMAGGRQIQTFGEDPKGWREIPPETTYDNTLKLVCAR